MAITNTSLKNLGSYTFDEIGTFSVDQLAGVSFDRQFSPFTNITRDLSAITWGNVTTTWATETNTWESTISDMDNTSKPQSLGSYTFDEIGTRRIDETGGAMSDSTFMINTSKPT